jgi:lysophospholipase L1-like esterase
MRSSACGLAIGFGVALSLSLALSASISDASDQPASGTGPGPALPRIVLVGDSIRLGYAPIVAKRLEGKAIVISPKANGGDSANVLRHLDEWVIREQPDIVHFNCGIHDTKKSKASARFQVPPEAYEANLREIVGRIRAGTKATVIFATTTPVLNDRAARARTKAVYELLDASTEQYNAIARKVMDELGVPVNDLRAAAGDADTRARRMGSDGIHFQPDGREALGDAVAAFLAKRLRAG